MSGMDPPAAGEEGVGVGDDDDRGVDSDNNNDDITGAVEYNNSSNAAVLPGRRNWEESFQALVRFKNKFGNCLVPSAYEEDTALGHWVRKQRRNETAGQLSPERRDKLDKLGFVWKLRGDQYANAAPQKAILEQGMQRSGGGAEPPESALAASRRSKDDENYYNSNNSNSNSKKRSRSRSRSPPPPVVVADAPTSLSPSATPTHQSRQQRQKTPSPSPTPPTPNNPPGSAGAAAGATTTTPGSATSGRQKRNWMESYDALVRYAQQYGNCNVPRRYPPDLALGQWVSKQRFQKHKLTSRQYDKLRAVGFDFVLRKEKHQKIWEDKLGLLRSYKNKHGHCNVPSDYMIGDLGRWVAEQRKAYAEERLQQERITALEKVGLVLDNITNEDAADGGNNDESDYEDNHGPSGTTPNSSKAARQQQQQQQPARVKVTLAERWETQYEHLARFQRAEGHCVVPRYYDRTLSMWAQRQRVLNLQNKLKQDRKDMLEELNFEWYVGIKELPEHYFDEMIQRLVNFQQTEGHVDVPRTFLRGGLGEWIHQIKKQGRDGSIGPVEAERLLRVGFTWMENRDSWYRNFEDISFEVTNCRRRDDELSLSLEIGNWLKVQYMLLEYDLIPPKRVEKLESLGLDWDGENFSWREVGDIIQEGQADVNVMVFDDEISTGYDLKDAAISWTPDRKAARKATSTKTNGSTGSDSKASPIATIEADATETQDTKESDEVVPDAEERGNQGNGSQVEESQPHQDSNADEVVAEGEEVIQDKDKEVEKVAETTGGSQVSEAKDPDETMQERGGISQEKEGEGEDKLMRTNEKSGDTYKDAVDEETSLEPSKDGSAHHEEALKSTPLANPDEAEQSSQAGTRVVESMEEPIVDKKRAHAESSNQNVAEDEDHHAEPDPKKGRVQDDDDDCQKKE